MDKHIYQMLIIPNCKNKKLIEGVLKLLSRREKFKILQTARQILYGKVTLSSAQYRKLSRHKHFLRNLSTRQLLYNEVMNNYNAFQEVLNIMLQKKNSNRNES